MATQMSEEVKQFLKAISKLSALYEAYPELPVPVMSGGALFAFPKTREDLSYAVRTIAYLKPRKQADDDFYYRVIVDLAKGIELHFCMQRDKVCERVKTGTRLVEIPARPATEAKVVEEPVYEWKCADSLLAPGVGK